jgi:hypothetical protein
MSEYIPANPPSNSRGMQSIRLVNEASSVRDRQVPFAEEPAPFEDEQVEIKPTRRRSFVQPPTIVIDEVFRNQR